MTGYIVQTAGNTATVGSTVTVTLPSNTRAGNCLIVITACEYATTQATISGVTIGGNADNFAQVASSGASGNKLSTTAWCDPNCNGGATSVVVTFTGGTGALTRLNAFVLEVGGLMPSIATLFDSNGQNGTDSTFTTWSSGSATESSTQPQFWVNAISAINPGVTAGQSPWINVGTAGTTGSLYTFVSSQSAPILGVALASGTFTNSSSYWGFVLALNAIPAVAGGLPNYVAGSGPQQGDISTVVTGPLAFAQQQVVFRGAQTTTTTTVGAGAPGSRSALGIDTVYEDNYRGFNSGTAPTWTAPFTGWYRETYSVSVGACAANTILISSNFTGLPIPTTGGVIQSTAIIFAVANGTPINVPGFQVQSSSTVSTTNSPPSTWEITWLGFSAF